MHSSCVEVEQQPEGGDVLVAIAALVTEGRTPTHQLGAKARGFSQGPHCSAVHTRQSTTATTPHNSSQPRHLCNYENALCLRYSRMRSYVVSLWRKSLPLCIDVLLVPRCCNKQDLVCHPSDPITNAYLLEQWHVNVVHRTHDFSSNFNVNQLINAIRSQLYFSQLSAWLDSPDEQVRRAFLDKRIVYSLTVPGETYGCARFASSAQQHHFPSTDLGHGVVVNVSLSNLPRAHHIPPLTCSTCEGETAAPTRCCGAPPLDDRMQTSCTLNGKHRCEDYDEVEPSPEPSSSSAAPSASVSPRCSCIDDPPKLLNYSTKHCKLDSDPTASEQPDMNLVFTGKHRCKHSLDESDRRHFPKFNCSFNAKHCYNQDSEPEEPLTGKHRCKEPEKCSCPKFNCSFKHCKRETETNLPVDQDMNLDIAKVLCSCPKFNGKHSKRDVDSSGEEQSLIADLAKVLAGKHRCKEPGCGACPKFNCLLKNKNCCDPDSKEDNMSVDLAKTLMGKHRCKHDEQDTCSFPKMLSDRLQTCTLSGKHRCKDLEELSSASGVDDELDGTRCVFANLRNQVADLSKSRNLDTTKCDRAKVCDSKVELELSQKEFVEVLHVLRQSGPLKVAKKPSKGDLLLDALVRCSQTQAQRSTSACSEEAQTHKRKCTPKAATSGLPPARDNLCDMNDTCSDSSLSLGAGNHIYVDISCDKVKRKKTDGPKLCDISNVFSLEYLEKRHKVKVKQRITFDDEPPSNHAAKLDAVDTTLKDCKNNDADKQAKELAGGGGNIPSALEQAKFRKSLDSAASMVFHSRTGLPLTSSPAPVRRGKSCFDFDSSINSVSAIRSALFSLTNCSTDEDSESDCSIVSPCSPDATNGLKQRDIPPVKYRHRGQSSGLLGSFVESVLNGRLEPVSTVHGFTAELGASGSFCPRHVVLPVTVFFYTLGDNDKVSTPYLGHINLGKKGYNVPKSGTIQVTLFNPLGTVVKMFVLMYDLSDMPPNAQTFLRQRTLYMPANCHDQDLQWSQKWLRYLIHLRFMSSKSGRIYLHSDIRMIICRKSDLDTATAHGIDMSYELRSFTNTPTNPRFSPRK